MGSATTQPEEVPAAEGMAVTSIRIERERLEAFKRVAESHRRSVSQEMRWLIDRHIEEAA
jgi:predicted DNA-binding protein